MTCNDLRAAGHFALDRADNRARLDPLGWRALPGHDLGSALSGAPPKLGTGRGHTSRCWGHDGNRRRRPLDPLGRCDQHGCGRGSGRLEPHTPLQPSVAAAREVSRRADHPARLAPRMRRPLSSLASEARPGDGPRPGCSPPRILLDRPGDQLRVSGSGRRRRGIPRRGAADCRGRGQRVDGQLLHADAHDRRILAGAAAARSVASRVRRSRPPPADGHASSPQSSCSRREE